MSALQREHRGSSVTCECARRGQRAQGALSLAKGRAGTLSNESFAVAEKPEQESARFSFSGKLFDSPNGTSLLFILSTFCPATPSPSALAASPQSPPSARTPRSSSPTSTATPRKTPAASPRCSPNAPARRWSRSC